MRKSTSGFTIVELIIVVVVIGILASIVIVSFNGAQKSARNADRYTEVKEWEKLFQLYKAKYGTFPPVANKDSYCLGTGFPNGKCREYLSSGANTYLESDNAALMTELKKIGTLPTVNPIPVNGWIVGPYVNYWGTGMYLTEEFEGGPTNCPSGMSYNWDDGNGVLICGMSIS
ncbi:MAG TPA: prepilin-type N-terminal cleavage/methylation domain-containing protein [Verrucomicrobiae bacterium]|nr:prepilin-type N-terminal cleavage/methylation domain-containing protein [Verrucomicrobiae bacterium]